MIADDRQYDKEADLLKAVTKWLAPQVAFGIKMIRINDKYQKGYSDIFISVKGWLVVAELKDSTGTASPHQLQFIEEMKATGAVGGVCRSVRDVADLVDIAKARALRVWRACDV